MDEALTIADALFHGGPTQVGGLLLARLVPIASLTPVFGGEYAPRRHRFAVAMLLALLILPAYSAAFATRFTGIEYAALLLKEGIIGLVLSVLVTFIFEAAAITGEFVDLFRDATIATIFDPMAQGHSSILGRFLRLLVLVIFFSVGGARLLILALKDSFVLAPPQVLLPPRLLAAHATLAADVIGLMADLFLIAFRLAAPVMVIMLFVELTIGLIGRAAQGFDANFLSRTVKGTLGLGIALLAFGYGLEPMLAELLNRLFRLISGQ